MPLPEEIGKAYANYYTHRSPDQNAGGQFKRIYLGIKRGYFAAKYGYKSATPTPWLWRFAFLLYLFPVRRNDVDAEIRRLRAVPGGRLLDVGCGSGDWLVQMRNLGWQGDGVDFDANAVASAREKGLNVNLGTLESQQIPEGSYDAITLNHVIEHVPDALGLLRECRRVLKPGGTIALATPNAASWGHSYFKENWRGLEPPRHLQVFTPASLRKILGQAGFTEVNVRTDNSVYVWDQSYRLWWKAHRPGRDYDSALRAKLFPRLMTWLEQGLLSLRPDSGECLGALAKK